MRAFLEKAGQVLQVGEPMMFEWGLVALRLSKADRAGLPWAPGSVKFGFVSTITLKFEW